MMVTRSNLQVPVLVRPKCARIPGGVLVLLITAPYYEFNWQIRYELAEPKLLPKGTKVEVIAHFDNSPTSKFNPDSTQVVNWGDQTWEEMMIGFIATVRDLQKVVPQMALGLVKREGGRS